MESSNMNTRAEMGVGTLIIFIAILLVVAVAAGVLIQTSSSLQQQALSTGSQATGQISTNAQVLEISAIDGLDGNLENFSMLMRLAPGSSPITLEDAIVSLASKNTSQSFTYTEDAATTEEFSVNYLQQGPDSQTGVLVRGDVVELVFIGERSFVESEDLHINFLPRIGTATRTSFSLPMVISTQRVYVYP